MTMDISIGELKETNRLHGSMIPMSSQVLVYSTPRSKQPNGPGGIPDRVKIVQYHKIPDTRVQFITETSDIFVESEAKSSDVAESVLRTSQQYQKKLLGMVRENTGKEAALFSALHSIWQLAHITIFDFKNKGLVFGSISEWIRLNFTAELVMNFEAVIKSAEPSSHPLFWKVLKECVMRGYFDPAKQLLEHVANEKRIVNAFTDLLSRYPKLEDYPTNEAFKQVWYKWRQDAIFALENLSALGDHPVFTELFSILAGVEDAIINSGADWHHALLGLLHFVSPLQNAKSLGNLVKQLKPLATQENILDQVQFALMEQDLGVVVGLCSQFDWWLVTHLVVLIDKLKLIDDLLMEDLCIREWYLSMYAEYIMMEPQLRFVALKYYLACPTTGKASLHNVIPKIVVHTKDDAETLVRFCKKNGLKDTLKVVLTSLGKRAIDAEEYEDAITYLLGAEDFVRIGHIVECLLKRFELTGDELFAKVAANLPPNALFKSPTLAFLTRYHSFRELYKEKKYGEAAELVYMLFSSASVPRVFWRMLLLDTLPLLEGQIAVFNSEQVMELMRCVEICTISEKTHKGKDVDSNDDSLAILKMALARSLAAAIARNE